MAGFSGLQGTANEPFEFVIYAESNQDGNPDDMIPIAAIPSASPGEFSSLSAAIPSPVNVGRVGDWFAIGIAKDSNPGLVPGKDGPVAVELSPPHSGRSWLFANFSGPGTTRYPLIADNSVANYPDVDWVVS